MTNSPLGPRSQISSSWEISAQIFPGPFTFYFDDAIISLYVWEGAKHQRKNIGNWPWEYTLDDKGLVIGKIQPQEYSIRLLNGPTRTMAGRSAQTVNNMPAGVCMDRVKGEENWRQQRIWSTKRKKESTQTIKQILTREKSDHRKIQYASSKVELELCLEGRLRQSAIFPHIYVCIEAKEQITDAKNVRNRPREYNLYDTGLGTGKIRPHEY